jgi:hydroxymethylpyrimidine pyrophosphatase-like HAD family hydrolase
MSHPIQTLQDFYQRMNQSRDIRRRVTQARLNAQDIDSADMSNLARILSAIKNISPCGTTTQLKLDETRTIDVDLSYELNELEKDLFFLQHPRDEFEAYLSTFCPSFMAERDELIQFLQAMPFQTFITDRDGTVNNYCGRYASSIQSVYNAVFLCRYAKQAVQNPVMLTSAPLKNIGLLDIVVTPPGYFIYAASKGREYMDRSNTEHHFPIRADQVHVLESLNQRLTALTSTAEYEKFTLIGSGLQFKYGQTTVARQDISGSITPEESQAFKQLIEEMIQQIDPQSHHLRMEDTGKDLEIILTVPDMASSKGWKDFDKGDAIHFLNQDIPLHLGQGPALVCGDTASDLPMMAAVHNLAPETRCVLVTTDHELREKAQRTCQNLQVVTCPDILVSALDHLSRPF